MPEVDLYLWDSEEGYGQWVKAPAAVKTKRFTAAGQSVDGAHKLYWLLSDPSAANSAAALTDDDAGGGDIVIDGFEALQQSFFMQLNPPMRFNVGIYLETFDNMTSITIGYI